ncbi:VOC family protein [Brevifollis gellanilyticus]|uniref:Putative 3-demethylubiquinone-9 3-methyltransferase n=1 Tax=Brevifollis gellanilyticus TaxID=748831 RepID=A0A512MF03_9BACT|nr:VOC family protein [Brevifollis gellanilyticus]GEP45315.1 putative 3-demethylubiquinone-9 3-methyltransferase [Brevifollis gellanilyticus]
MQRINPCLWFSNSAQEAVEFYRSVFKDLKVLRKTYYPDVPSGSEGAPTLPPAGTLLTLDFELFGQLYTALNGGPDFPFTEAISLVVNCKDQEEIDCYWEALLAGGGQESQCGWLRDKFGLSWQIVPIEMTEILVQNDPGACSRMMQAMFTMVKLDIATLRKAAEGS